VTRAAVAAALVVTATVAGFAASSDPGRTVHAQGVPIGSGGEYHTLTPARLLDTREPSLDVEPFGRKQFSTEGSYVAFDVPIVGEGGLPAFEDGNGDCADDNVLAVAVNVTVVNPTHDGWLKAFGKGAQEGTSSVLNFRPGEIIPNTALLRPGCDGELTIRLYTGAGPASADVLIDVFGWISSSAYTETRGARLEPAGPGRIFDSREAPYGARPFGKGEQQFVPIRGADAYSPDTTDIVPTGNDVTGVLVNVTAVNNIGGSLPTYVSLLPRQLGAGELPTTSNLNLRVGQIRSNLAIVPLSSDGGIWVYNHEGNAHVVLDVMGYFVQRHDDSTKGRIIPLVSPFRAFDTRDAAFGAAPLPSAFAEDWSFADFVADVKVAGTPVGPQIGLIGNLTAANLGRRIAWESPSSYVTAYPSPGTSGGTPPFISNLGISEGEIVPNLVMLEYGADTMVRFYNRNGNLDYLLDVTAVVLA
jgi:hypothetical protein